jgi:hypothetical protein
MSGSLASVYKTDGFAANLQGVSSYKDAYSSDPVKPELGCD